MSESTMKLSEELQAKLDEAGVTQQVYDFVKQQKEESYQAGVGNVYESMDTKISELFGSQKNTGLKTTEFLANSVRDYKVGIETDIEKKYKSVKGENKTLKEQLESNPDASKYESLRKSHNEALKEHEEQIANLKKEFETKEKTFKIENQFSGIQFNTDDSDYLNFKKQSFISKLEKDGLLDNMVDIDGKIVLKGGEAQGHKDFVLNDMIQEEFKNVIKSDANPTPPRTGEPTPISTKLAGAKTKSDAVKDIRQSIIDSGINVDSTKWDDTFGKALEENKDTLDKLE